MEKLSISEEQKSVLSSYLTENPEAELVDAYLQFLEATFKVHPVLFIQEQKIYRDREELIARLEKAGKIWRETDIKIDLESSDVDENTLKVYICPFTGRVFGDNTHPNPQDAIYDWVSKCPENTERVGGLRVKRFFVSEDPKVIEEYIAKDQEKQKTLTKTVFSSVVSGKLFSKKEVVMEDFQKNHIKPFDLTEIPKQDRFELEEELLGFIQEHLTEEKIAQFVESLSEHEEFASQIETWVG